MQLRGRQTQFYIDIIYGIGFAGAFGYLLFVDMDPGVAAFQGGLVFGYILRVWEKMTVYERILHEEVAAEAEEVVAAEAETVVAEEAQQTVADEVMAEVERQVPQEMDERFDEEFDERMAKEMDERFDEEFDERVSEEVEEQIDDRPALPERKRRRDQEG